MLIAVPQAVSPQTPHPPSGTGVRGCAGCHAAQAGVQPASPMAHAMEEIGACGILKAHPLLTVMKGRYSYRIERKGSDSIYSVTDGRERLSVPLRWALGLGRAGQTYVFEIDGAFYETRVSYYSEPDALDLTIGAANAEPANILQAAGDVMDRGEAARCFGCHATGAAEGARLSLGRMVPGIQCERCHGPAADHAASFTAGNPTAAGMRRLEKLSSEEMSNFCGQCHRTWAEIAAGAKLGVLNVRFQPYRLTISRCYDSDDARISCVACHDPHRDLDMRVSDYDAKCLACHGGARAGAAKCSVARVNCVSCHMAKVEMPGSHHRFTDHNIRIVRANAPYPD